MRAIRTIGLHNLAVLGCVLGFGLGICHTAKASKYLIDASYAGVEGTAGVGGNSGYAAVYSTITAALGNITTPTPITPVPSGTSGNPNLIYIAPGTYNTANDAHATGVTLSNSKN